jgi:RNA polymerase sigma-70 factor (ECF subfamily)
VVVDEAIAQQWRELHGQWREPVRRYVEMLGLSEAETEDVTQETFLALLHHLREGKPQDNLRGWVFRVAGNQARRRFRRPVETEMAELVVADERPNPEEQAIRRREHEQMGRIFRALPETERHCLLLRAEGLSYREIAAAMEIPLSKVAACLTRGLERLAVVTRGGGR